MAEIDKLFRAAYEKRASDLHLSAGEPVRMRIDGDLVALDSHPYSDEALQKLIFEILSEPERKKCLSNRNLDKSYGVDGCGFFRVNVFWTRRGVAAVMRSIPFKIPTLEDLGLPPVIRKLSESPKGLVLVTGPTGSGKSTTLAAMINYINSNFQYHILTAEDPVEFVHESKQSLINQREIGANCPSFADALKYALREDPDVILVGEMRDLETISLALTAAETGHLVFGTLHTRGAGASVDRIIDSFPANQQAMIRTMLAESLVGVVSQALLKRADSKGRVAAFEILVVNHAIANLIREGKTFQMASSMQTGRKEGMLLMEQHILELVQKGVVSADEALSHVEEPNGVVAKTLSSIKPASKPFDGFEQLSAQPMGSHAPSKPLMPAMKAPKMPLPNVASKIPATAPMAPPQAPTNLKAVPAFKQAPSLPAVPLATPKPTPSFRVPSAAPAPEAQDSELSLPEDSAAESTKEPEASAPDLEFNVLTVEEEGPEHGVPMNESSFHLDEADLDSQEDLATSTAMEIELPTEEPSASATLPVSQPLKAPTPSFPLGGSTFKNQTAPKSVVPAPAAPKVLTFGANLAGHSQATPAVPAPRPPASHSPAGSAPPSPGGAKNSKLPPPPPLAKKKTG